MASSSPDSVISLPSGGGAVQGMGETFAPDLFTGTGNLSVPLPLPPGRGALSPQLSLGYSTGHGRSIFGMGWALSVPGVSRSARKGLPRYRDGAEDLAEHDTFVLSGAEDLVPVEDQREEEGWVRYRPRTEGLFADIRHVTDGGADYWRVRTTDGLTSYYGSPPGADEEAEPPVTADPDPENEGRIYAWHLARTEDLLGNHVVYEYERDEDPEAPGPATAVYLKRIRYADFKEEVGIELVDRYLVSVTFVYEEREDAFSDFTPGFEIRVRRRCTAVQIRTHAGSTPGSYDEEGALVKVVKLTYLDQRFEATPTEVEPALEAVILPANGASMLYSVTVEGHDGEDVETMPALVFDYSRFEPERQRFRRVAGPLPATGLGDGTLALVDMDGNGLPDLLQLAGGVARVWKNQGNLRFGTPRPLRDAPHVGLDHPGVQLLDADGDGRPDLYVHDTTDAGYFPIGFDGAFDRRGFRRYGQAPSLPLGDPSARFMDLDGDGVTDLLHTGAAFELFYQDADEGWSRVQRVRRGSADTFPDVDLADPRVRTARLSGAALDDVVLIHDGNVELWPTLGYGRWGTRRSMRNAPRFPYGYDPRRVLFGDMDGDGLDDLIYVNDGEVRIWINQGGGSWSEEPVIIRGTPRVTNLTDLRIVDLLGNGTAGLLYSRDTARAGAGHYYFLDLTDGRKPYLLTGMDNGLGAVTHVTYRPSTHYALADAADPDTRWKTPLPFPVQVVSEVVSIDRISEVRATQSFRYHHGYWDGHEREFRGFGRVDQRDTETFDAPEAPPIAPATGKTGPASGDGALTALPELGLLPEAPEEIGGHEVTPTETRTWFHLGPVDDGDGDWTAKDYTAEFWGTDPAVLRWNGDEDVVHVNLLIDAEHPEAPIDPVPISGLSRAERRDALRALRGQALRTELYSLDEGPLQSRPYTVTESVSGVRLEETSETGVPVFFAFALAARTTEWDRGEDPMTQLALTGGYDEWGRPTRQTAVAVPRGRTLYEGVESGDEPYIVSHSTTDYAEPQAEGEGEAPYLYTCAWRATAYEVTVDPELPFIRADEEDEDLIADVLDGTATRNVIGQSITYYDGDAFEGRDAGEVGPYGLPSRVETLVLTVDILEAAYAPPADDDPQHTDLPPYLDPAEPSTWPTSYPTAFRDALPAWAGYAYHTAAPYAPGYYAVTGRTRYDVQTSHVSDRGLPLETLSPLGVSTEVAYDAYEMLPTTVTVEGRLTTTATYDYDTLQVRETTDPNGSRARYAYTPLGLLASTFVMGKDGADEGDDDENPSTTYSYDLHAFVTSGLPASATTVRRVYHVNDPDLPSGEEDSTITSMAYADGFGRVVQTRTQAEDELFGEAPFYDNVGLPVSQSETGEAAAAALIRDVVAVSGHTVYDRKGRPIEQYEPYYDFGFDYDPDPEDETLKVETFYDARGRAFRVVHPDGSEDVTVFGIPDELDEPESFTPTPWESYVYDRNDNAGRTHALTTTAYSAHRDTPASVVLDTLGRVARRTERLGPDPEDEVTLQFGYDIRGNRTHVTDALGRLAHFHVYDLTPVTKERGSNVLRTEHLDAGTSRAVFDAAGTPVEGRNAVGSLALTALDALGRPAKIWARDGVAEAVTLRQRLVYGDDEPVMLAYGLTDEDALAVNLLGRLYRHYDEAGVAETPTYDFKGNPTQSVRQVFKDSVVLSPLDGGLISWEFTDWVADWTPTTIPTVPPGTDEDEAGRLLLAGDVLDARIHTSAAAFDALGRPRFVELPEDADSTVRTLRPTYTRAGGLKSVALDEEVYVERIAYDARGQRVFVAYGNGLMTRYAYDEDTRRLARVRTEAFEFSELWGTDLITFLPTWSGSYAPDGSVRQDTAYGYDLVGNIRSQKERAPDSGISGTGLGVDALDRAFGYDPLYRLVAATGREHLTGAPSFPWDDPAPYGGMPDPTSARAYTQNYTYDLQGNALELQHVATGGSFTRTYGLETVGAVETNRLSTLTVGSTTFDYTFDAAGQLVQENTERHHVWDAGGRLRSFRVQVYNSGMFVWDEPTVYARYLYDAAGSRVKKVTRVGGDRGSVTYVGGAKGSFEWHEELDKDGDPDRVMSVTHVSDETRRIAEVQAGTPPDDDTRPPVRYHLGDHLGNSVVTIGGSDATGVTVIEREEYYPFGETSYGSHGRKRWRYNGKERDGESGLYMYGARYYAPWAVRFVSVDPLYSQYPEYPPYAYAGNKPVSFIDLDGMQEYRPDEHTEPDATRAASGLVGNDGSNNITISIGDSGIEINTGMELLVIGQMDPIGVRILPPVHLGEPADATYVRNRAWSYLPLSASGTSWYHMNFGRRFLLPEGRMNRAVDENNRIGPIIPGGGPGVITVGINYRMDVRLDRIENRYGSEVATVVMSLVAGVSSGSAGRPDAAAGVVRVYLEGLGSNREIDYFELGDYIGEGVVMSQDDPGATIPLGTASFRAPIARPFFLEVPVYALFDGGALLDTPARYIRTPTFIIIPPH